MSSATSNGSAADAEVVHGFGLEAERYDAAYDARGGGGHVLRSRLAAALRLLGDGAGSVLDVGMGPGRLCAALSERGWTVSGVDPSPQMVERARLRVPERRANLLEGRAEALPFSDRSFDAVVATGSLEFVDDLERSLAELARVTDLGGTAVLSFPNYHLPYALFMRLVSYPTVRALKRTVRTRRAPPPRHRHPHSRARFEQLLTASGFEIESAEYVGVHVVPRWLARQLEGRQGITGRLLAGQIMFVARRPAEP